MTTATTTRPLILVPTNAQGQRRIAPTDISQFIRLGQCERYLRLQLHRRMAGDREITQGGVNLQRLSPLLTQSGREFETDVETNLARAFGTRNFAREGDDQRDSDNAALLHALRDLAPGREAVWFQPRMWVDLGAWSMRGDIDVLVVKRTPDGQLTALVADIKSSRVARVEHRLQVAFYGAMFAALLDSARLPAADISLGIIARGPAADAVILDPEERERIAAGRALAREELRLDGPLLERLDAAEADEYRAAVRELVTSPDSRAARVAERPFADVPHSVESHCDGCMFQEPCFRWTAEHDDLSLIPYLGSSEKSVFIQTGVTTTRALAALKDVTRNGVPLTDIAENADHREGGVVTLRPGPGKDTIVRQLSASRTISGRLDELILRAKTARNRQGDGMPTLSYIPNSGAGSLPRVTEHHHPNLVWVYLDAQWDYLHDRLFLVGARVVGCDLGRPDPARTVSLVAFADSAPETAEVEERLLSEWVGQVVQAVADVAATDPDTGERTAPIHLVFNSRQEQTYLLDGLARHARTVLEATPLYDFVTHIAAFDSPLITILSEEIRSRRNWPIVSPSLYAVAGYLQFDWNAGRPFRRLFKKRIFDQWMREPNPNGEGEYYIGRARFSSAIPLEYAHAAWGDLAPPPSKGLDPLRDYRPVTRDDLVAFGHRRLQAIAHVADALPGNRDTTKTGFKIPDLATFEGRAGSLAAAMDEFLTIERHVTVQGWKTARLPEPEQRVLAGNSLMVRYLVTDQDPDMAAVNLRHQERQALYERYRSTGPLKANGEPNLSDQQKAATKQTYDGLRFRLRLDISAVDCDRDEVLNLTTFKPGDRLVVFERTTVDSRLPLSEQVPLTPTAKQLLYGMRATLIDVERALDDEGLPAAWIVVELVGLRSGSTDGRGYTFRGRDRPFVDDQVYTLDEDPNNPYGAWCHKVVDRALAGTANTLLSRLTATDRSGVPWSAEAAEAQRRFFNGLVAFNQINLMPAFEQSKEAFIGGKGDASILLVQGPPGTGKSYTTAFAVFARLQGALAADQPFRAVMGCRTHAATDVLLRNVAEAQETLRSLRRADPERFAEYFDPRLLQVPLYRVRPQSALPEGVAAWWAKGDTRDPDDGSAIVGLRPMMDLDHAIIAATPGGIYKLNADQQRWKNTFTPVTCLVMDEASQMNLPEAAMFASLLAPSGQLIVVGDHRQMPPIIKHDWRTERRRTFHQFRAFDSLFDYLRLADPAWPTIRFVESFRLHSDMAEFLRQEVYRHDGIAYFSRKRDTLRVSDAPSDYAAAVLRAEHPLVVVVHGETGSQVHNNFELDLTRPLLEVLTGEVRLDARTGLGVVVPHRAQRAALLQAMPELRIVEAGGQIRSAVDTIERFQGGERRAMIFAATESDPAYLMSRGDFLFDPRRLTVALSRAKEKMILIASRSVFDIFSADEETFRNTQLWKNLLRRTCTVPLWSGNLHGYSVEVWGNAPTAIGPGVSRVEAP